MPNIIIVAVVVIIIIITISSSSSSRHIISIISIIPSFHSIIWVSLLSFAAVCRTVILKHTAALVGEAMQVVHS